jgi:aminoglycoside phosphotransferase (APT) family kinase protein
MEEGWERPPHAVPSRDELSGYVAAVFPSAELERHQVLTTGLANTNARFWLRGDPDSYVLRLYTRDPRAQSRESALMRFLAQRAPTVPVPQLLHTAASPAPYSVWKFVEGELLQSLFQSASRAELLQIANACGQTLAALAPLRFARCGELDEHLKVAREYGAPSDFVPQVIYDGLAGLPGQRLGSDLSQQLKRVVDRTQPLLHELDGDYSLVHADYKRSNLLVSREASGFRVAAVLDWEFACAGPPLLDFGLFLRAGRALPTGFQEAFAEGYLVAGGKLPQQWLPLSRFVDLVSQITFLDGEAERPRVWAETRRVVEESLALLSAL